MKPYQAWDIKPSDFPHSSTISEQIKFVCHYGLLAPSVHNTQPWKFSISGDVLELELDPEHALREGDGTGRETILSLGACLENLVRAGEAFGMNPKLIEPAARIARIKFEASKGHVESDLLNTISSRTSTRFPFRTDPISTEQLESLRHITAASGTKIVVTSDPKIIELVAELTGRGIGMALSFPTFKRELAALMRPNWSRRGDGMPGFVFGQGPLASLWRPWEFAHLPVAARESKHEAALVRESAALALVFSKGDTAEYWLEAGRSYQRMALAATGLGLSTSTTAAAVEAPDFHTEIEAACETEYRLQTIMRVGYYEKPARHSPRRELDATITSNA